MTSRTTKSFRSALEALPPPIRAQARNAFKLFSSSPNHPGLHFKRVYRTQPVYSVRISAKYRAVGSVAGDEIIWFWIGSHADYDKLLARMSAGA